MKTPNWQEMAKLPKSFRPTDGMGFWIDYDFGEISLVRLYAMLNIMFDVTIDEEKGR